MAKGIEISVLWFVEQRELLDSPVSAYLEQLQSDGVLRYRKAGRCDTNESWEAIVTVLLTAVAAALAPADGTGFRERR